MQALRLTETWPVDHVVAAVIGPSGSVDVQGNRDQPFRIASVAKTITTWACLVAVEEGIVTLDQPVGQPGCTLRHLLSHAGGYGFEGKEPIARPERNRIYSNTGIEMVAGVVSEAAGMPFVDYLDEAVLFPLGMSATLLNGSPAHRMWSTAVDLTRFVLEVRTPTLISAATAATARAGVRGRAATGPVRAANRAVVFSRAAAVFPAAAVGAEVLHRPVLPPSARGPIRRQAPSSPPRP